MIELVLVVFLISIVLVATAVVKVGLKAVDFIEATYKFYERVEKQQQEIIRLLESNESGPKDGV